MTISNPTPQRALRAHQDGRPSERAALTPDHQTMLAAHLTARDRWLARMLHEHRVLTSTQIAQLAFGGTRSANKRLRELYRWRIVDRFQPFRNAGSAPMHYVLDVAGAAVLAAEDGVPPNALGYRHHRAVEIAHSLQLAHTVAVNGVFTALVGIARHSGTPTSDGTDGAGARALTAWWSEARCARYYGEHVRPDGYGRWRESDGTQTREVEFFLEYDFGTEPLTRVAAKLTDYQRLAQASGINTPVLFWFPTTAREDAARNAMTSTWTSAPRTASPDAVPVATTASQLSPDHATTAASAPDSPAGPRWLPLTTAVARTRARPRSARAPRRALAALPPRRRLLRSHARTRRDPTRASRPTRAPHAGGLRPPTSMPPDPVDYDPRLAARAGRG